MPTGTALRVGAAPRADPNCRDRNGAAAFVLAKNGVVGYPFFEMNEGRTLMLVLATAATVISFGMAVRSMPAQVDCGRFTSPRFC